MAMMHRYSHDGTGTVHFPGRRLLAGFLVVTTLALAAPTVAEARDTAGEDGATVVIGGLAGRTPPPQEGAIGVGDTYTGCVDSNTWICK